MARKCCVIGCDDLTKENIIYFPVPIKPVLYKSWAAAVRPAKLTAESLVCHQHFLEDDYQLLRGRHRLKAKVVPSLFGEDIKNNKSKDKNETNKETEENNQITNKSAQSESVSEPVETVSEPISEQVNSDLDRQSTESVDENGLEKCTIECQPEAFLQQDSDSDPDTDLHKGDIEDIIANYHIKQNRHIADRVKQDSLQSSKEKKNKDIPPDKPKKRKLGKKAPVKSVPNTNGSEVAHSDENSATDSSDIQYVGQDNDKAKFIEVAVNSGSNNDNDMTNDCMMLLEDVQVEVDPSMLLSCEDEDEEKPDPISLLTSSDEDDVILQEPHIDTVEVSDATDEDDVPLVKLVNPIIPKIKLKAQQETLMLRVCEICDYTTSSPSQMFRHRRKHNEKRYKCNLCEYRAMHNMSLVYHMKSHNEESIKTINFIEEIDYVKLKNHFKCVKCSFKSKNRSQISRHSKQCMSRSIKFLHGCKSCGYKTERKLDLRRHVASKHKDNKDLDKDYVP